MVAPSSGFSTNRKCLPTFWFFNEQIERHNRIYGTLCMYDFKTVPPVFFIDKYEKQKTVSAQSLQSLSVRSITNVTLNTRPKIF